MPQFFFGAVKADQNPAFVEIGGSGGGTCINQHRGGLCAIRLNANTINSVAKTRKHLAADFPAIKFGCGISGSSTGIGRAKGIDEGACHLIRMA